MPQLLRRTPHTRSRSDALYGHTGFVEDLLGLPSGVLVSVDSNGTVIVWDVAEQRPLEQFAVATSPLQGVGAIPGTEDIAVWGWEGALLRLSVPDLTGIVRVDIHEDRILNARFGFVGDQRVAATASMDRTAALVDIDTGDIVFRTPAHDFWVVDAYIWNDHLVTASRDGTVRLFDAVGDLVEIFALEGAAFVAAGLRNDWLVAASIDGTMMCVDLAARTTAIFSEVGGKDPAILGVRDEDFVVGGAEGLVRVLDIESGEVVHEHKAHDSGVLGGIVSNQFVISYGLDRLAVVMTADTLERVRSIDAHDNLVGCVAIVGDRVITGSADQSIRLHDPNEGGAAPPERHRSLVTGMRFIEERLISWGYNDSVARAWDPRTGSVVARRTGHVGDVSSVAKLGPGEWISTSHDGTLRRSEDFDGTDAVSFGLAKGIRSAALTGSTTIALGSMIGRLIHLDVDEGELWRYEHGSDIMEVQTDRTTETVAFSDGSTVVLVSGDGEKIESFEGRSFVLLDGILWVFGTGVLTRYDVVDSSASQTTFEGGKIERGVGNRWGLVAVDSGGRLFAFDFDGTVRWTERVVETAPSAMDLTDDLLVVGWHNAGAAALDIRTGEVLFRDEGDPDELIVDVTGEPDTGRMVVIGWSQVRLHMLDGSESFTLGGLDPRPDSAWFVNDEIWIGAFGSTVYRWNPGEDAELMPPRHYSIMAGFDLLDDGRLITWGWDGRVVVDAVDERFRREWGGHGSFVYGCERVQNVGLVSWSYDGTARIWSDVGREREAFHARTRGIQGGGRSGGVMWLGTSAGELYAWDPAERRVTLFENEGWHRGAVHSIVGHEDFVATACAGGRLGIWTSDPPGNIAFWDVPESGGFRALAIHPEGRIVIAAGQRGNIIAVDPLAGEVMFDISAHGAEIRDVAFAPDADLFFSVSEDSTIACWDLAGELVARARLDAGGYSVAVDQNGVVAAGDSAGRVLFFDFANEVH